MEHKNIPSGENHTPYQWIVDTQADRQAITPSAADLHKHCLQCSDGTQWRLSSITPIEWAPAVVGQQGPQGPQGEQGPQGPQGEKGDAAKTGIERTAAANLSGHRIVMIDGQGSATYASNDDLTHATRIVGMTTHAAIAGAPVAILTYGEITEPGWNWNVDQPVYLGIDGLITQIPPEAPDAKFLVVVGFPISATTLYLNLRASITLTA